MKGQIDILEEITVDGFCGGEAIQQDKAVCIDGNRHCAGCKLDAWAEIRKDFLEGVGFE